MPEITVIVPFYQEEDFLTRCVESILCQSFSDFELLLISDGAREASLERARSFADSRVQVVDKPHTGLGDTRNTGVKKARGSYLLFVDADDWIEPDALRDLYRAAKCYSAQMVLFNYVLENEATGESTVYRLPVGYPEFDKNINPRLLSALLGPDSERSVWNGVQMLDCAWRRLYRRDWFLQHRLSFFDEQKVLHEDLPTAVQAHFFAKRMVVLGGAYYHYRYHPQALGVKYRPRKMQMLQACYELVRVFLEEQGVYEPYRQRHLAWLLSSAAHEALRNCFLNPAGFRKRWAEVRSIVKNPLVQEAAQSPYLQEESKAQRRIHAAVRSGRTAAVYAACRLYLSAGPNHQTWKE